MKRTPMKRSAFKRPVAKVRAAVERGPVDYVCRIDPSMFRLPVPITTAAAPVPKAAPVRSEAYRRAVASLPCVMCRISGYSQAAHGSSGKGMAMKACDLTLFPACCARPGVVGCHAALDQGALFKKAVRHELEPVWAADTQRKVHAMGLWPAGIPYPHDQGTKP